LIAIENIKPSAGQDGSGLELTGVFTDPAGIRSARINSAPLKIESDQRVPFRYLLPADMEMLRIEALDRLGNQTVAEIPVKTAAAPSPSLMLAASDLVFFNGWRQPGDPHPPAVELKGWSAKQTVFMDKVYLEGMARDDLGVVAIRVNAEAIASSPGKIVFFNRVLALAEGVNTIDVEVEDAAGNLTHAKIEIERRIPEAFQLDARLKVSVFPFKEHETVWDEGEIFQEYLIDAFVGQERFRVVERSLLDILLQEQRISASKLVDRSQALKIGRLAAAQSLVAGRIIETRLGVEIVSRMIDTETSDILATIDVFGERKGPAPLAELANGLAMKYHREFPLCGGLVIHTDGNTVVTDLGREEIKLQRRIIVYKERPVRHPLNNRLLGTDKQILCHARVTQVQEQISKARFIDDPKTPVKDLYKVVAE
jgi:hypothetical protein